MQALGMSCTNRGFLGFPIAALAVGPAAATVFAQNLLIENLVIIPAALVLAELGRGGAGRPPVAVAAGLAASLARNPLILAILAGIATAALGLPVPAWIDRPVAMLAGTAAPVALVVIGGTIATLPRAALPPGTLRVVAGKLLLHPLAVLAMLLMAPGLDPLLVATGVIFASVPMITVYPIIGAEYGEERATAAALLAATLAAIVTVPLTLVALEAAGFLTLAR
jgi:predicted permease